MWFVTLGSMAFLIIWIAVDSFVDAGNFTDEVWILFSTVDFLATVVLSIILAIAPRFIYKYVMQTYDPLDKELVREMWVQGDLKDRLGLSHRTRRRGPTNETTSFFRDHRSANDSEIELDSRGYYDAPTTDSLPNEFPLEKEKEVSSLAVVPQLAVNVSYHGDNLPSPALSSPDPRLSYYSSSDIPYSSPGTPTRPSAPKAVHLDPHIHDGPTTPQLADGSSHTYGTPQTFITADDWAEDNKTNSRLGTGSSSGTHSRLSSGASRPRSGPDSPNFI